jgi:hypothetical protein
MIPPRWTHAVLLLALTFSAAQALADVPDPAHSTVGSVLAVCPEGDMVFTVVARNFVDRPMAGVSVVLKFGSCPSFASCPDVPGMPTPYAVDGPNRMILQSTGLQGIADLPIRMGGTCPDSLVVIYGDGVVFARRSVVSPDQNGDLVVDATDLALLQSRLGQADPTGDFDGDGIVTAADVAALREHMGHACSAPTPVTPTTWGRLKLLYR